MQGQCVGGAGADAAGRRAGRAGARQILALSNGSGHCGTAAGDSFFWYAGGAGGEAGGKAAENDRTRQSAPAHRAGRRPDRAADGCRPADRAFLRTRRGVARLHAVIGPGRAEPFLLGLLGILAVIGVVTLFASAIGLLRFSARWQEESIGRAFADAMDEGVILTDKDGRIVYANRAYADLTGAEASATSIRSIAPSPAMPMPPRRSTASRRAFATGRPGEEEVRMPRRSTRAGPREGGARWYRISARPVDGRRGRTLTAWRVADVSAERARQEAVFLELQHAIDYLDHAPAGFLSAEPDGRIVYINATLAEWLGIDLAGSSPADDARRHRARRRDRAAACRRRRRGDAEPHRDHRSRPGQAQRAEPAGPAAPPRAGAADGAPGATRTLVLNRSPARTGRGAARGRGALHPLLQQHADRHRRGRRPRADRRTNASFLRLFGTAAWRAGRASSSISRRRDRDDAGGGARRPRSRRRRHPADRRGARRRGSAARASTSIRSPRMRREEAVIVNAIDITEQRALEAQFAPEPEDAGRSASSPAASPTTSTTC
jgi:two-component system, cell cycle sensor histidine kinase and response regulator CckA